MSGARDLASINVILATDCGSTTTKAILIERTPEGYRQTCRGEAPTTVEQPFADVTVGVVNAVTEIAELSGRKLVDEKGSIIRPSRRGPGGPEGCDIYISTSSAGGGLQMVVAGVVAEMTAASAKRAALGAGAIVMEVLAANDRRRPHEQIQRLRELRPDMILLSGGTDGGDAVKVVEIAERIAPARPQARFGSGFRLPLIFAGNRDAAGAVTQALADAVDLRIVENIRPVLERENLGPAREAIHDMFLEHVMAHAPGYEKLMSWTDAPIMPTPAAVGNILRAIATQRGINALGVDIGGATTDVFSVFGGAFNRTVSANLGMSYSIANVCAEAGLSAVMRWVHLPMNERELRNRIKNKMVRPTTIPQTVESLVFEQAVAREALRLAFGQHREFATGLRGVQQQRTVGDTFSQESSAKSIVDPRALDLLVGSGGVLSHAPRHAQTVMMLLDAFQPEGFTELAKDSIFMMPHLGVLAEVHPAASLEVFERDCLIPLGTCIAPAGAMRAGKPVLAFEVRGEGVSEKGTLSAGELRLVAVPAHAEVLVAVIPERGIDAGFGPGRRGERKVRGGTVGVIFDARGRPIEFSQERSGASTSASAARWAAAMSLYPAGSA